MPLPICFCFFSSLSPPTEPSAFDYLSNGDDSPFQYSYYDEYNPGPLRHAPLRGSLLGPPRSKSKTDKFPHLRRALRSNMAAIKHYGRVIKRGGDTGT